MTAHAPAHEVAHEPEHLDLRKLGMWIFLASEVIFFGALIITFLVYKDRTAASYVEFLSYLETNNIEAHSAEAEELGIEQGVLLEPTCHHGDEGCKPVHQALNINITALITFILLTSSLTMVLALSAIQRGRIGEGKWWLIATIILGTFFVGTQVYEYIELLNEGLTIVNHIYGSGFFTLTGFHGTHVFVGVILLLITLGMTQSGKLHAGNALPVELVGLYWHFVDLVWLVLFTIVYLI